MAEVFAPFIVNGTIRNLTFYCMEGRNFVRKKSSLTRRKVLYASCFKNTRYYAGLMGQASKIGSLLYNALPVYWRQSWMYRSFTGEAFTLLKKGKKLPEIQEELWQRYIAIVVSKQKAAAINTENTINALLSIEPKRAYRKQNSEYWKRKTSKSNRRKARRQQTLYYAGLMGRASKIGSKLYAQLPHRYKRRSHYQYLTGLALKLLKQDISEDDILAELLPTLSFYRLEDATVVCGQQTIMHQAGSIGHPNGQYFFVPTPCTRMQTRARLSGTIHCLHVLYKFPGHHHQYKLLV